MKKTLFISLSLLAGFTFTSCQKEPSQGSEQKPVTITINAVAGDEVPDGKAYLKGTTTWWNAGDAFDSRIKDGSAWKDQIFVSQNETAAAEAEFKGTLETSVTKGSIWAYFPANSKTTPSKVRKLLFDLSAQNFTKLSDFGKYSIMVAAKPDYIINNEVQGGLTFRQVTAAFNFRITNNASDAITLTKAVVSTENDVFASKGEIWGTITYNDTDDTEFVNKTMIAEPKNATNKLTLTYSGTQAEVVVLPNDGKAYASQLCFFPTTQTVAESFKGTKVTIKVYYTLNGVNRVLTKTGTLNQIITRATKVNIPLTIDGTEPESGSVTTVGSWAFTSGGTISTWNESNWSGTNENSTFNIVGFNDKYVEATTGSGKIQFYNATKKVTDLGYTPGTSATTKQARLVAGDGTPFSIGFWPGDYWYFEAPYSVEVGDVVSIATRTKSSSNTNHPQNWIIEYSEDGTTWKETGTTFKFSSTTAFDVAAEYTATVAASKIYFRFRALATDWTKTAPTQYGNIRIVTTSLKVTREE